MNHQVRPQLEWSLQHRGSKGIFTSQGNLETARQLGHGAYFDHFHQRVRRGFEPQKLGLRAASRAKFLHVAHVHERMLKSPAGEEPGDKLTDTKVQIPVKNDMVARC